MKQRGNSIKEVRGQSQNQWHQEEEQTDMTDSAQITPTGEKKTLAKPECIREALLMELGFVEKEEKYQNTNVL